MHHRVAAAGMARPPLKWAGGKRWQLPALRPIWAHHAARRLVEPFCGGLAVALGLYARPGYTLTELDAPRRISRTGDRRPAREALACRNL
jgi:hypothetical protein